MNAVIQLTTAARVLAQLRGKNAVRDSLRRQGFKTNALRPAELTQWARLFVEDHPELVQTALADAKAMILSGALGKRAAKALRAKLESDAQSKIEPISMGSAVQISGAK